MLFTVTYSFNKEEVHAIGKTLFPMAKIEDALGSATPLVTEWITTTVKRKVRELMERPDVHDG